MVSAVGHISGGHFNPAITFGFMLTRRISVLLGLVYWVAQLLGGVLAALLLRWMFPAHYRDATNLGAPCAAHRRPRPRARHRGDRDVLPGLGRLRDGRATRAARTARSPASAIGLVIIFDMLLAYPLTGGAVQPGSRVRAELVSGSWTDAWIWYVGPLAGGAIAALLYDELYLRPASPEAVGPPATGVEEPGPGGQAADL